MQNNSLGSKAQHFCYLHLPFYCSIVLLYDSFVQLPFYCPIVLLYDSIVLLLYCTILLSYCSIVRFYFSIKDWQICQFAKKLLSFSRYLTFYLGFFGAVVKRFDKKEKVNFKIYDVTVWLANNCNTHIVQYLEK